jgi:hypothetical protein
MELQRCGNYVAIVLQCSPFYGVGSGVAIVLQWCCSTCSLRASTRHFRYLIMVMEHKVKVMVFERNDYRVKEHEVYLSVPISA